MRSNVLKWFTVFSFFIGFFVYASAGIFEDGVKLLNDGKLDEALKIFKSLSLKNENVLNNIAVIYIEKKNYEKAENYLKKALDINPSFEDAVFNLGICYFETKNWTKLIKLCEKYENTFKNQKDNILTIEAYSYYRLRKFEKSKKIFKIINKEKLDKDVKTLYKMLFNKLRLIYGL